MDDEGLMRRAIAVAWRAREAGNHPFGAVLADAAGRLLLEAENTVNTDRDVTAHAELALVRQASAHFDRATLAGCTLYASTEPCPMCAGAIFWSGIGRVVFGLTQAGLYEMTATPPQEALLLSCAEVLGHAGDRVTVVGPVLQDAARAVHKGAW